MASKTTGIILYPGIFNNTDSFGNGNDAIFVLVKFNPYH
jgi:hypothetical protein